jgi:hypothetical protein
VHFGTVQLPRDASSTPMQAHTALGCGLGTAITVGRVARCSAHCRPSRVRAKGHARGAGSAIPMGHGEGRRAALRWRQLAPAARIGGAGRQVVVRGVPELTPLQELEGNLFAASLFPYLGFLYYLCVPCPTCGYSMRIQLAEPLKHVVVRSVVIRAGAKQRRRTCLASASLSCWFSWAAPFRCVAPVVRRARV